MATLSTDKKIVTVQRGDTLSEICLEWLPTKGINISVSKIAKLNNIKNVNRIYIGQKLKLDTSSSSGSSSSTTTSTTSKKNSSNKAVIDHFGEQSDADRLLFATWTWNKSNTENYKYIWYYDTGDGVWFIGSDSTTENKQCTYTAPANAKKVRFKIKPISKKKTVNKKETSYWTAEWSSYKTYVFNEEEEKPEKPNTPTVKIEKFKLTATLDNVDASAKQIQFQIVKNDSTVVKTITATVKTAHAECSYTVSAGNEYKVRCRAVKNKLYSEWSEYSNNEGTITAAPKGITSLKALSETSVEIKWSAASKATGYEIEYATKKTYFDHSDQTTTKNQDNTNTTYILEGLESGQEYFFRVRAKNEKGESAWTDIKSIKIGKAPAAPTTWSSTTTVISGEDLTLYWVHNSEDGSSETQAQLEIYIGDIKTTETITNTETDEEEKDKTKSYTIDTSSLIEGSSIKWRVRTAGTTKTYGDWSVQRTVDIYTPPTLELSVTDADGDDLDTITSFPFYIRGLAGPDTQIPIGYHVSIVSKSVYETVDNIGNEIIVNEGDEVYSEYFNVTDTLRLELLPSSVNLENNVEYTVKATVSMNSGLTAESSIDFTVAWEDVFYHPNAEISIDEETYSATVRPYCEYYPLVTRKVELDEDGLYIVTSEVVDVIEERTMLDDVYTITEDFIYSGTTTNGEEIYFSIVDSEEPSLIEGVTLSVYRREYDGKFVEIATGLNNVNNTYISDPHPALDLARYRVVAIDDTTGAVSYYDVPGEPVGGVSVVIQWDEDWSSFDISDVDNGDALEQPTWGGSMLKLPYNIDVSNDHKPDVAMVNYIGREHPVSYYGTHLGETATWNVDVLKSDKETLYGLRRLAKWQGDVYVREPSGSGYWANIVVSFSQKHCDLTIPVTFNITRVEGGV